MLSEERIIQGLRARGPFVRIVLQQIFHQAQSVLTGIGHYTAKMYTGRRREIDAFGFRHSKPFRPGLGTWRAQDIHYLEQRVDIILAREQISLREQFCHNAATSPHVYRRIIHCGSQQQLGSAIPLEKVVVITLDVRWWR